MARHPRVARAGAVAALALVLTGCGMTEYRGPHAAIDGSLWRLVSSAEDGMRLAVTSSLQPPRIWKTTKKRRTSRQR